MFVPVSRPATIPAKLAQLLPDDWLTRPAESWRSGAVEPTGVEFVQIINSSIIMIIIGFIVHRHQHRFVAPSHCVLAWFLHVCAASLLEVSHMMLIG